MDSHRGSTIDPQMDSMDPEVGSTMDPEVDSMDPEVGSTMDPQVDSMDPEVGSTMDPQVDSMDPEVGSTMDPQVDSMDPQVGSTMDSQVGSTTDAQAGLQLHSPEHSEDSVDTTDLRPSGNTVSRGGGQGGGAEGRVRRGVAVVGSPAPAALSLPGIMDAEGRVDESRLRMHIFKNGKYIFFSNIYIYIYTLYIHTLTHIASWELEENILSPLHIICLL